MKIYSGRIEATPELRKNDTLKISRTTFHPPAEAGHRIRAIDEARGLVIGLASRINGRFCIHGSAIVVAPGVAITATHVIREIRTSADFTGIIGIAANSDSTLGFWQVVAATSTDRFDIALLTLRPLSDMARISEIGVPILDARSPKAGERLMALGFRDVTTSLDDGNIGGVTARDLIFMETTGRVTEIFPSGRDRVILPNPCVATDFAILGGMSGGPVFDESGRLIGISSSSFDGGTPEPPTFVSLIWPAIVFPFAPAWPPKFYEKFSEFKNGRTTLQSLDPKILKIIDGERVSIADLPNGGQRYSLKLEP